VREGGKVLVEQLVAHGSDTAFTVPGESFLPVLDALYDVQDKLKLVVCRHEAGAANMAEAYGKLTNRPGIALVTRAPGATQAAIGVHTASRIRRR
jgi:acetolactate synthase-1/2/3 large subunit